MFHHRSRAGQYLALTGALSAFLAAVLFSTFLAGPAAGAGGDSVFGSARVDNLSRSLTILSEPGLEDASVRKQASAVNLPAAGPMSIPRGPGGSLRVEIVVADTSPAAVGRLVQLGARVLHVSQRYSTITANLAADDLRTVGSAAGVRSVTEVLAPQVGGGAASVSAPAKIRNAQCGVLVSDASSQLLGAAARARFDVDGSGLTVGVLSDSFATITTPTSAAQDVASGALPGPGNPCGYDTPVQVLQESPTPSADEGRAMLQMVHGVAPGARLMFAAGSLSKTSMADNIFALAAAGADIIVDDISYNNEPLFQDGIIATAVTSVTAAGGSYFSSAGNANVIFEGNDVGSWESPVFRPTTCPSTVIALNAPHQVSCMNFATSGLPDNAADYTIAPGASMTPVLQWAQPVGGVTSVFAWLLIDPTKADAIVAMGIGPMGVVPVALGAGATDSSPRTLSVVVVRYDTASTATPRVKYYMSDDGAFVPSAVEYPVSTGSDIVGPTIFGHNGTAAAMSVAAVPYNSNTTPESFSSRGPNTLFFQPVSGTTPSAALAEPQILAKPDFTATDDACNTMLGDPTGDGPSCPYRFSGTSAAAPNGAAVAALLLEAVPGLTPAQVRTSLANSASPMSGGSLYSTGSGLLNAEAAIVTAKTLYPQKQVACRPLPKKIKRKGVTTLVPKRCRTNAGRKVKIRASADLRGDLRLYKLIKKNKGKIRVRTYGYRINLTVTQRAKKKFGYKRLNTTKTYKLRARSR